ncbi:MAG: ADP-ribose pyrophosphatase [Proteobacteria bacterium]|nr:MAG: ADP-ribose pyrophosphatase [Pseudomonadota bacterium]
MENEALTAVTLESKLLLKARVFEVHEKLIKLPSGSQVTRQMVAHPGAAVILPLDSEERVVMVRQYRFSAEKALLELPAGTLEIGEEPLICAKRELEEEVKCSARDWQRLGILFPAPGFCNEVQHCFMARDLEPRAAEGDEDELIEVERLSVAQVEEAIRSGELIDGKSVACLFKARLGGYI